MAYDQWSFYQANSIKAHGLEVGEDLITLLAPKGDVEAAKKLEKYQSGVKRYEHETKEICEHAKEKEKEARHAEHQALRFDFAEGLL